MNTIEKKNIEFTIFTHAQKKAIEVAKWIEGEKIQSDPGEKYNLYWVKTSAKDFKQDWEKSKCKECYHSDCRYKAISNCSNFVPNPELNNENT